MSSDQRRESERDRKSQSHRHNERERRGDRDKERRNDRDRDRDRDRGKGRVKDNDKEKEKEKDRERNHRKRSRSRSPKPSRLSFLAQRRAQQTAWDKPPESLRDSLASAPHQLIAQTAAALAASQDPLIARQAKRLYIGGIPNTATEGAIQDFFNSAMHGAGLTVDPFSCVSCQVNLEKSYAFIEFSTIEETTKCLSLDGIVFQGQMLKLRRPKDYMPPPVVDPSMPQFLGVISTNVIDTPYKIFIGGIPATFSEDKVKEMLQTFGPLKAFNLVRDSSTGLSKGYAFCEFLDPEISQTVIDGMNGLELGEKKLVVQFASVGARQELGVPTVVGLADDGVTREQILSLSIPAPTLLAHLTKEPNDLTQTPTRIVVLYNIASDADLRQQEFYDNLVEDMRHTAAEYGNVLSITIPRPLPKKVFFLIPPGTKMNPDDIASLLADQEEKIKGMELNRLLEEADEETKRRIFISKVLIEYDNIESATQAAITMGGLKYDNRTVISGFYDEDRYRSGDW